MNICRNLLLLLSLTTYCFAFSQNAPFFINSDPKPNGRAWAKVGNMSDEFNNGFNTNKWSKNPVSNGWTWRGRVPGLFEPSSVSVGGGNLRCTVLRYNTPRVVDGRTWLYRGGIVRSKQAAGPGHYFECRMKANATEMSSTFWLKPRISCGQNLELDIQECVGKTGPATQPFAQNWDRVMHSNMFNFATGCGPENTVQIQGSVNTNVKNHSRFFVYGCYVESPTRVHFYLDGRYRYSITPPVPYNVNMFITMAMETYDWNPVPNGGGKVASGTWPERTTKYDWVRTWRLVNAGGKQVLENAANENSFDFYPNPAQDNMSITTGSGAGYNVEINDIKGSTVKSFSVTENTTQGLSISDLSAGLYIVKYQSIDSGNILTKKLLVQ